MASDRINRVRAVLRGESPDHPPFSCWYHFDEHAWRDEPAVAAHLRHVESLDLDFLKIMNDNLYPRPTPGTVIETLDDLKALKVLTPDAEEFAAQLDVIRRLTDRLGGAMLTTTTMFNGWSTLRYLCAPPTTVHRPPVLKRRADPRDECITALLREDRSAVTAAVDTISRSLAAFATACIEAGADGVFLSVRDDWVDTDDNGLGTYAEIVRPADLRILEASAAGEFNMLHVCGRPLDFDAFARYPMHVIHWADRCVPPSIADVITTVQPAVCGGLDNLGTLVDGSPEECAAQARDAVAQAGDRPILVAPGCTYTPAKVPLANLRAARDAVRSG